MSITRPVVGTTTFAGHDAAGNVGSVTDVNGRTTELDYDKTGRLTQITNTADGSVKNIYYNAAGLQETTIDEDGITRNFIYEDVYGRLDKIVDHRSNAIFHTYNAQGDLTQKSYLDPEGAVSSSRVYEYTGAVPGLLYKEINADNSFVEYRYDADGNVSMVIDALSKATEYIRDSLGRVTRIQQINDGAYINTYYGYDIHGNLAAVTDGESHTTHYTFDDMGRVVTTVSPDTGTTVQAWDAAGNRVFRRDAKDHALSYVYDDLNRLTQVTYPSPVDNILYSYDDGTDGKGRMTGMMDPSGATGLMYDARGRLVEKTFTREGESLPLTLSRQFTLAGRQSSLTYPSGRVLTFERRDCACGVDGIFTHVGAAEPVTLMDNLIYRPFGGATATDTGSGDTIANQHDADGRLAVSNPGTPREQQIAYDANGNLKTISNPRRPWEDVSYTYFDTGWLKRAVGPYGVIDYTYDNVGNRQTLMSSIGGVENAYVYQVGTNRISTVYGPTIREFTHDARGNMTRFDGMTLAYNADNRLMSVTGGGSAVATYTYNGFGQRISKTVTTTDKTTVFLWDFEGNIIAEYDGEGALKAEYLYRGANRLAMADAAGEVYFYQNDRLGTPQAVTDKDNNAVWEATYLPFGQAMVNPNSAVENNFRFPGQYFDEETGLHYNYHRYYDPRTGRYVTADPIGLGGGINLYAYVQNDPVNLIDMWGLVWFRPRGADYYVGRDGEWVEPGKGIGKWMENNIPAMHDTGYIHDDIVTNLRAGGLSDLWANYPTMPIAYVSAFLGNLFGHSYTNYPCQSDNAGSVDFNVFGDIGGP